MATRGGNRGGDGETQVQFIMLNAKGNVGDLQQIAQAIVAAVRPTFIQQIPATPVLTALPRNGHPPAIEANPDAQADGELQGESPAPFSTPKRAAGSSAKRHFAMPSVVEDLDLDSGDMPFTAFYKQKNPKDHSKRYLVIAAWLKDYQQINEIGIDHIYTCYRKVGQNVVKDVGGVFRGCKKQGWFQHGSQPGWYAINHIGLGQVNDMGKGE